MANKNKNYLNIPQEDVIEISYALSILKEKLIPHLKKNRIQEDREMPDFIFERASTPLNRSYINLLKEVYDEAVLNPMIIPNPNNQKFDLDIFRNDILAAEQLLEIKKVVKKVLKEINKTHVGVESRYHWDMFSVYAKHADFNKVPGASDVLSKIIFRRKKGE